MTKLCNRCQKKYIEILAKKRALNSSIISKEKRTKSANKSSQISAKKSALPKNSASNSANISNDLLKVPKIVPNKVPKIVTSY